MNSDGPEATRNANATITLEANDGTYTFDLQGTTRAIWGESAWGVAAEEDQETWGRIYFDPDAVVRSNATEQDLKEIAEVASGRDQRICQFLDRISSGSLC